MSFKLLRLCVGVWLLSCTLCAHAAVCAGTKKINGPCGSAGITDSAQCDDSYGFQDGQGFKCKIMEGECVSGALCDAAKNVAVMPSAICTSSAKCKVTPTTATNLNCDDYNGHEPAKMLDGDVNTLWHGDDGRNNCGTRNGKTPIIKFTFPEKVSINYMEWYNQADSNVAPIEFEVMIPEDGKPTDGINGWKTIAKFTNVLQPAQWRTIDFSSKACVQVTELALKMLKSTNTNYGSMGRVTEVNFYTKKDGTAACKETGFPDAAPQLATTVGKS